MVAARRAAWPRSLMPLGVARSSSQLEELLCSRWQQGVEKKRYNLSLASYSHVLLPFEERMLAHSVFVRKAVVFLCYLLFVLSHKI